MDFSDRTYQDGLKTDMYVWYVCTQEIKPQPRYLLLRYTIKYSLVIASVLKPQQFSLLK